MKPGPKPGSKAPNDALTRQREIVDAQVAEILADAPQETRLRYLIDGMVPANQVHLLAGPSGGGKTTLAFQMLSAMTTGEPFLGRWTRKVAVAYVSGDRPAESVLETQDRCKVSFPIFSAVDENLVGEDLLTKIFPRLTAVCGGRPDVIYIDGFTAFVPGGFLNNYAVVAKWLASLQRFARKMKVTIIGACHATKTKEGEKFTNPRQRIAGSVAWAGFSETVLIIEPLDGEADKAKRVVHILPRNHAEETMFLKFNAEGMLMMPEKVVHQETITAFIMDGLLGKFKLGDQVVYSKYRDEAMAKGVSLRTFNRWLAKAVAEGTLVKTGKGLYVYSQPSEPTSELGQEAAPEEAKEPTIQ